MNNSCQNNRTDCYNQPMYHSNSDCNYRYESQDFGPHPYSLDLYGSALENENFRTTIWTGNHLQLTLMSLKPAEDIGMEIHPDFDQFIRVESGKGIVMMSTCREHMDYRKQIWEGYAFFIPAGTWHNFINTGCEPLKLFSIYAPIAHAPGTVHRTKRDAEEENKQY